MCHRQWLHCAHEAITHQVVRRLNIKLRIWYCRKRSSVFLSRAVFYHVTVLHFYAKHASWCIWSGPASSSSDFIPCYKDLFDYFFNSSFLQSWAFCMQTAYKRPVIRLNKMDVNFLLVQEECVWGVVLKPLKVFPPDSGMSNNAAGRFAARKFIGYYYETHAFSNLEFLI